MTFRARGRTHPDPSGLTYFAPQSLTKALGSVSPGWSLLVHHCFWGQSQLTSGAAEVVWSRTHNNSCCVPSSWCRTSLGDRPRFDLVPCNASNHRLLQCCSIPSRSGGYSVAQLRWQYEVAHGLLHGADGLVDASWAPCVVFGYRTT